MVRPTSPAWCPGCQHQVAVMNTVPEVTILSGERRLQPPPVQCEVLCAFRHRQPLCKLTVLREGASRSATRTGIQWPAGSRTSTAAILLAGIGKYYRTIGLQVAKVVSRLAMHRDVRPRPFRQSLQISSDMPGQKVHVI